MHSDSIELDRVGPGAYFGELAILDGEPRSATVVADTDVKVAVIGIRMFRTLLREFSDLAEQLLIALAGELREARKVRERELTDLGIVDDQSTGTRRTAAREPGVRWARRRGARRCCAASSSCASRRAATVLIRQGDAADGLYLVGSGRLQVDAHQGRRHARSCSTRSAGASSTGEMALLTDSPRSASIVALRDSHVFFLSTEAFDRVDPARTRRRCA